MIRCSILGATGYVGAELARLLLVHPQVDDLVLCSSSAAGETFESIYPNFYLSRFGTKKLMPQEAAFDNVHVVFSALPHGKAEDIALLCQKTGALLIDMSADFRMGTREDLYSRWYGLAYTKPLLHAQSVYGLPELNRKHIAQARIIGNPGCYATSAILGIAPALKAHIVSEAPIIIDGKSGITGAGKGLTQSTHFPESSQVVNPYKVGEHRHNPEIELALSHSTGEEVECIFTPHCVPLNRGIVNTIYVPLKRAPKRAPKRECTLEEIHSLYRTHYLDEPFIRVLPLGSISSNRSVIMSNMCDISVHQSQHKNTAIIISSIDNMIKGAAGQAIQNMNIAMGFEESAGLDFIAPAF